MAGKKKVAETAEKQEAQATKTNLVKMVRDDGRTADVHPLEVDDYKLGGFQVVQ